MTQHSSWYLRTLVLGALGLLGLLWTTSSLVPGAGAVSQLNLNVNTSDDTQDTNAGDGECKDTNDNCSLRAAIEEANAYLAVKQIKFVSDFTIDVDCTTSALPPITADGLTVDAQAHDITVRGDTDCDGDNGLVVNADDVTVKGLRIGPSSNSPFDHAIVIGDAALVDHVTITKSARPCVLGNSGDSIVWIKAGSNVTVRDCFIGLDPSFADLNNASHGIEVGQNPGGDPRGDILLKGNTIGFVALGIISETVVNSALNLTITNNYIGTDQTGTQIFPSFSSDGLGFVIDDSGGPAHVVITSNRISNQQDAGIGIHGNGEFTIKDNKITHNSDPGIELHPDFTGTALMSRNVFGLNGQLAIDLDLDGVTCGPADGGDPSTNNGQRCPTITSATAAGVIKGTVDCFSAECVIEVYAVRQEANDSGHGEGVTFLGSGTVNGNGVGTVWTVNTGNLQNAQRLSATSTSNSNKTTSEFGPNFTVTSGKALVDGVFLDAPDGDPLGGLKGFGGDEVRDIKTKGQGGVNVSSGDGPLISNGSPEAIPFRLQNVGNRADRFKLSSITSSRSLKGITITFDADPAGASANDLNKINDGTTSVDPDGEIDGVLRVSATSQAALGKYTVIINFKANGSSSNDQGDSVTLKFKVTTPV